MFVRKKKNNGGLISIQVIEKSRGKYKVLKTIGSSKDNHEIEAMINEGKQWIKNRLGLLEFEFEQKSSTNEFLDNIEEITVAGTTILLEKFYNEIGFDKLKSEIFKSLVFSRIVFPSSKLKTTELLSKYYSIDIPVQRIYRYLDTLYTKDKTTIQKISYEHTLKILGNVIGVIFYDVTTLYFQIDKEDDVRRRGFSKEGKHQNPQILLGLLVSIGGYPLAYEIFEGNKFEGHTILPVIDSFKRKYKINQLVIIADSGLLSNDNIEELEKGNYEFILGARIKNEKEEIKQKILSLSLSDGKSTVIKKGELTLVVNYSKARAYKDKNNRERGLERLEKQIKSGKLTKANINNRGYNKYLRIDGDVNISIDKEKFEQDGKWDGLKGYITNTTLPKEEVIENYKHLWVIEMAFRISKHDLKIRPIYHRLQKRIEAHILISFVAYKIYKELERQLKEKQTKLSPEKVIELAKTIYSIKVRVPNSNEYITKTLLLNDEQKYLANLFELFR